MRNRAYVAVRPVPSARIAQLLKINMHLRLNLAIIFFASFCGAFVALPAAAQTQRANLAAAENQCNPGKETRSAVARGAAAAEGAMPLEIPGATTVSPKEANCMIEKMGLGVGVVAAMRTKEKIPGTILELPQVAGESEEINLAYAKAFRGFTGGDKSYPILFYCHHERCQLSVMATKRAVEAGYTKIYWLRAGNSGWVNAGLPLEGQQQSAQAGQSDPGKAKQAIQVYQVGIRNCTSEVTDKDFAEIALKSPTENVLASNLHASISARKDNRDYCLKDLRKAVANADPRSPALADIDTHLARGGDEIERGYKAARA